MVRLSIPATIVCVCAWAAPLAAGEVPISPEAKEHFRRGVELLKGPEGPRCDEAYREFEAAYRASPSPKILGNLGMCAMRLERDGEAISAYERYLAEVGAVSSAEHRQISDDLVVLKGRVAPVRLFVNPPEATVLDERLRDDGAPVVNEYQLRDGRLELGVHPGRHRITVRREGYKEVVWELDAKQGFVRERTIELKPVARAAQPKPAKPSSAPSDAPEEASIPAGVWVGVAVTSALAVGTCVVGGLSLANKSSFEDALEARNYPEAEDLRDRGIALNIATDVLLGATVVSAGITTAFLVLALTEEPESSDAALLVGPTGLRVAARF